MDRKTKWVAVMKATAIEFAHWPPELRPRRGDFEMAQRVPSETKLGKYDDLFVPIRCWKVGPLAVHKSEGDPDWPWRISHCATGLALPCAYGRTLKEAADVARALTSAIDWNLIHRGQKPGSVVGMTPEIGSALSAMIYSFRFLAPFVDAMRGKKHSEHAGSSV